MPVTERQIIKPGPLGALQGNRVGGLACLGQKLPNRAVSQADADESIFRRRRVEPFGEICCVTPPAQRRRQYNRLVADRNRFGFIGYDYVRREARAS